MGGLDVSVDREAGWGSAAPRADCGMKTLGTAGWLPSDPSGPRVM